MAPRAKRVTVPISLPSHRRLGSARLLFFQVDAPALRALLFFEGATRAVIVAQITGGAVDSIVRKRRRRWGHWLSSLARPGRLRLTSSRCSVEPRRESPSGSMLGMQVLASGCRLTAPCALDEAVSLRLSREY